MQFKMTANQGAPGLNTDLSQNFCWLKSAYVKFNEIHGMCGKKFILVKKKKKKKTVVNKIFFKNKDTQKTFLTNLEIFFYSV